MPAHALHLHDDGRVALDDLGRVLLQNDDGTCPECCDPGCIDCGTCRYGSASIVTLDLAYLADCNGLATAADVAFWTAACAAANDATLPRRLEVNCYWRHADWISFTANGTSYRVRWTARGGSGVWSVEADFQYFVAGTWASLLFASFEPKTCAGASLPAGSCAAFSGSMREIEAQTFMPRPQISVSIAVSNNLCDDEGI